MNKRRAGAGVAELHGYLYVVGALSLCCYTAADDDDDDNLTEWPNKQ